MKPTKAMLLERWGVPTCVVDAETGDVSVMLGNVQVAKLDGLYEARENIATVAARGHLRLVPPVKR